MSRKSVHPASTHLSIRSATRVITNHLLMRELIHFPQELLLLIAKSLATEHDVNALCQTNRHLHQILNDYLYKRNASNSESSALQWAALHGQGATLQLALRYGADIHTTVAVSSMKPPSQSSHQSPTSTKRLFEIEGYEERRDFCGSQGEASPLVWAAAAGHQDVVLVLLEKGAAVGITEAAEEGDPLHAAVAQGHVGIVRILLERGFALKDRDYIQRQRLLVEAVEAGHADVVEVLLQHGADPDCLKCYSRLPLYTAACEGYLDIVRALLEHGAQPRLRCRIRGFTPLIAAIRGDHAEIVGLFLQYDKDGAVIDGRTVLEYAVEHKKVKVCEMLIRLGVDMDATDEDNEGSLTKMEKEVPQFRMMKRLLRYGAPRPDDGASQ